MFSRSTGRERVRELARLLGGDPVSEVSMEHARELLRHDPVLMNEREEQAALFLSFIPHQRGHGHRPYRINCSRRSRERDLLSIRVLMVRAVRRTDT